MDIINDYKVNRRAIDQFQHVYTARIRHTEMAQTVHPYYQPYELGTSRQLVHSSPMPAVEITMPWSVFVELATTTEEINDPGNDYSYYRRMRERYGDNWVSRYLQLDRQIHDEQRLREKMPALQKAWEHYQFTLELVKDY